MTEGMRGTLVDAVWTVGQVADELGVTVRTLHHYDEIGTRCPGPGLAICLPSRSWPFLAPPTHPWEKPAAAPLALRARGPGGRRPFLRCPR